MLVKPRAPTPALFVTLSRAEDPRALAALPGRVRLAHADVPGA